MLGFIFVGDMHKNENRLRIILAEKRLTHEELACAIAVTRVTVSRWATNVMQPSWANLYAIADFVGCDVRELLEPNENSPKKDVRI